MPAELRSERRDGSLLLTLSDPATRNALSEEVCAAGIESLNVAEADDEIRVVVLQGAGADFCAGGDVQRLIGHRDAAPDAQRAALDALHHWILALRACPKPVIASVEGAAAGAGFALALACDLIVAADDARFVLTQARLGLSPAGGASWHLARALPRSMLLQLAWLAEPVSARRLEALGLVQRVTTPGQALDGALELARRLAQAAPNALASVKELAGLALEHDLPTQLAQERELFRANLLHANGGEGLKAYVEQRKPRFG